MQYLSCLSTSSILNLILEQKNCTIYCLTFFFFWSGSSLEAVTTCELCKEKLQLNLEDFDIHELHRAHANEQVSIFCLVW